MSIVYNKPYSDGPYSMTDFLAGGHMFYIIYEFVLTVLDHCQIKIEPRIIENRWMDDFDVERIRNGKSHLVNYIINKKGQIEFSIENESYMGQSINDNILVFNVHGKKYLSSICYKLNKEQDEDPDYTW